MSRDAVERRLTKHTAAAARTQPSLKGKKVTPHVLRHTAAMRLLAAGIDTTVIALWLGHESVATTQIYTPTSPSRKKHSPEQRHSTSGPDATSPRTPSWSSSNPCDYAARRPASRHDRYGTGRRHRHNDRVPIRRIMPTSA